MSITHSSDAYAKKTETKQSRVSTEQSVRPLNKKQQVHLAKKEMVKKIIRNYNDIIVKVSITYKIPKAMIAGIIAKESGGVANIVSPKDARGLTQTRAIVDDAVGMNCNSFEPKCSIEKGAAYLNYLRKIQGEENMSKILLAYNRGPQGAKNCDCNPDNDSYVNEVKNYSKIALDVLNEIEKRSIIEKIEKVETVKTVQVVKNIEKSSKEKETTITTTTKRSTKTTIKKFIELH